MSENNKTAIVWFRDDLRTADHPALKHACESGRPVLAVYVHDEETEGLRKKGAAQKWFLHHALASLEKNLEQKGAKLHLFEGKAGQVLRDLAKKCDAGLVTWNRRVGEAEIKTDSELMADLKEQGITVRSFQGNLLHEPVKVKTSTDGPYRVYSPFWRALEANGEPREPLSAPKKIQGAEAPSDTVQLDDLKLLPKNPNWAKGWDDIWQPDEKGAQNALKDFLEEGLNGYSNGRNFPAKNHVSRLSPYLRFGLISPYQIWQSSRMAEKSDEANGRDVQKFLKELAWREFSYHLLFHYSDLSWKNFNDRFDEFPWKEDGGKLLEAWQKGKTGYPIVDAGMRELWQTGYMHNRVRMVVASFLVKHLLIHWRRGEEWFWDTLVDGDPANNSASWQWVAGCGADAAPYFRIFNPILQGRKFDKDGNYVRELVPEIAGLPDKYIHAPWEAPDDVLEEAGIVLGDTYPEPLVEHDHARKRALDAYKSVKKDGNE